LKESGSYDVFVIYRAGRNRATSANYIIVAADNEHTVSIDQTQNGLEWVQLGTFSFDAGANVLHLDVSKSSGGEVVIADAVRFTLATQPDQEEDSVPLFSSSKMPFVMSSETPVQTPLPTPRITQEPFPELSPTPDFDLTPIPLVTRTPFPVQTSPPIQTPSPVTVQTATTMHVKSINLGKVDGGLGRYKAKFEATIVDNTGAPVPYAKVTVKFTGDFQETATATTNRNGVAIKISTKTKSGSLSFSSRVINVEHETLQYNPEDNIETRDIY
jgi:hypothetical protein